MNRNRVVFAVLFLLVMSVLVTGCSALQRLTQPIQAELATKEDGVSHTLSQSESGYDYSLSSTVHNLTDTRIAFDSVESDPPLITGYSGGTLPEIDCYVLTKYSANNTDYISHMCKFGEVYAHPDGPVLNITFTGTDVAVTPYFNLAGLRQTKQLPPIYP